MNKGFSLVELLVVLLIIGIIAALLSASRDGVYRSQVREAQSIVAQAAEQARTEAVRVSRDQSVTWDADSITVAGKDYPLGNGVRITNAAPADLMYAAPYGELLPDDPNTGGYDIVLRSQNGQYQGHVYLVGVTGTVTLTPIERVN